MLFKDLRFQYYKARGTKRLLGYEAALALSDFKKCLSLKPEEGAIHYSMAVCYSLLENTKKGFYHLTYISKKNRRYKEDILSDPQLAFLRTQPEYEEFRRSYLR